MIDERLRPKDVQAEWGIATGTLKSWRASGKGPKWSRLGERRITYRRSDVEAWVAAQERQAAS